MQPQRIFLIRYQRNFRAGGCQVFYDMCRKGESWPPDRGKECVQGTEGGSQSLVPDPSWNHFQMLGLLGAPVPFFVSPETQSGFGFLGNGLNRCDTSWHHGDPVFNWSLLCRPENLEASQDYKGQVQRWYNPPFVCFTAHLTPTMIQNPASNYSIPSIVTYEAHENLGD